ncbi:hypothetical protein DSO57_1004594 [Entomophthora muscae]|uniref:Uncharacterized protein n=1 Tax=Entomophthora muscae TaxID=34485 RepID=A0ACC2RZB8_9FUNG|nr:hypothetical protein DSO57_1004594 [Entomophthora muscae]
MTPPLTPRPDRPLEPTAAAKTTSTQGLEIGGFRGPQLRTLVLTQAISPILWWALPAGLAAPHPEPPNASTYDWLLDTTPADPWLWLSWPGKKCWSIWTIC